MAEFKEEVRKMLDEAKKKWADNLSKEELRDLVLKIDGLLDASAPAQEPNFILARYTRLEALFEMIELGGVPLYGIERWDDECDKAFVKRGCEACDVAESECGIICFSRAREDEIDAAGEKVLRPKETSAMWLLNDKPPKMNDSEACRKTRIRIEFNEKKLLEPVRGMLQSAQDFKIKDGPLWLFDEMKYEPFQNYLAKAKDCKGAEWFFLKRAAYSWESEWRLITLNQAAQSSKIKGIIPVAPDKWREVIERVVFSPYSSEDVDGRQKVLTKIKTIRSYAREALKKYRQGKNGWSDEMERRVCELWEKGYGYRSGVLDNVQVLTAAKAKTVKPAKKASAKKPNATKKRK